ncbi:MAG: hypothetical protein U1F11_02770 [Steroidobacteraceae bacterium]
MAKTLRTRWIIAMSLPALLAACSAQVVPPPQPAAPPAAMTPAEPPAVDAAGTGDSPTTTPAGMARPGDLAEPLSK